MGTAGKRLIEAARDAVAIARGDPRPVGLPADSIEIVIDLPTPPSVNAIWRVNGRAVYRSPRYMNWLHAADRLILLNRQYPKQKITGPFEIELRFSDSGRRGDGDNKIKVCLDYFQSREIIANDKDCQRGSWAWADKSLAPHGCRVTLRTWHGGPRG